MSTITISKFDELLEEASKCSSVTEFVDRNLYYTEPEKPVLYELYRSDPNWRELNARFQNEGKKWPDMNGIAPRELRAIADQKTERERELLRAFWSRQLELLFPPVFHV